MTDYCTILDDIKLCQLKIRGRIQERETLQELKKHVRPDTYSRITRNIKQAIAKERAREKELIAIIDENPNELQRKVLYYKYVKGYTVENVAGALGYSDAYMRQVFCLAMKDIRRKYPAGDPAGPGTVESTRAGAQGKPRKASCRPSSRL